MTQSSVPITVADFEALARDRIEPGAWDYYAGGARPKFWLFLPGDHTRGPAPHP